MDNAGTNYKDRNKVVFDEVEALIESLGYGEMEVKYAFHNKRITSIVVYGTEHKIYPKGKSE